MESAAGVQGFCAVDLVLAGQGGGVEFWAGRAWSGCQQYGCEGDLGCGSSCHGISLLGLKVEFYRRVPWGLTVCGQGLL